MRHKLCLLYILFFVSATVLSAQDHAVSRRICSADGLSNDFITKLAVDGDGYVWTTSEAGVNRISGGTCQTFLMTEWPPTGNSFMQLADNARPLLGQRTSGVFGLKTTALKWHEPTGLMLIGTEFGLIVYDVKQTTVRFLTGHDGLIAAGIEDIASDQNDIWLIFAEGHVQRLDCRTLKVKELRHNALMRSNCGESDMNGHLYLGHTKTGMSVIDTKTGHTRHFTHDDNDPGSLPGNNVRRIYRDSYNRIWVGTDGGMALFHPTTGRFTQVSDDDASRKENVYDIHQMQDGTLWVATDIGGIKILNTDQDVKDGRMRYNHSHVLTSSLNTRAVTQDEYGNIWIGNHSTGVDFISERKPDFLVFGSNSNASQVMPTPAYSIARSRSGDALWIMLGSELSLWQDGKVINHWDIRDDQRAGQIYARCLLAASDGSVWIGVDDRGVMRFDSNTGRTQHITLPGAGPIDIHSMSEDSSGRIWIGSELGVYSYTKAEGAKKEDMVNRITDNALVTCFLWLGQNTLMLATYGQGAYTINLKNGKSTSLKLDGGLPSQRINHAISDGRGGLWLATHFGLVHVSDAMRLQGVKVYSSAQGLSDSYICSLVSDSIGRVWMSTYAAISCLDVKTERIHNYNHLDMGQACGFFAGNVAEWHGGLYFCSTAGVVSLNPTLMGQRENVSKAQIVSCEAYAPDGTDTKIILLTPDEDGTLHTDYRKNTLRISFCVRNQAQRNHVEYSYMMQGIDNKWYYIDNDNDVVFRGLPPGTYSFTLRAKLKGQDWNEASTCEVKIRIAPPLWQTWWAYVLYAIAIALTAYAIIRQYKYRLKMQGRLELEKRDNIQKQKINEERLHFFTNITHELRTPLTLILGPLGDLMNDKRLPADIMRRVGMIRKNAERLRGLTSELLEFRKTETQNRRLSVARGDLGRLVEETCVNYKELYNNPKVRFSYHIDKKLPQVYYDSEVITTILNNLLSNAIKYTEQGSISVALGIDDGNADKVCLSVADTGYGISSEALPHVFERYYQAEGSHQASGTGIGLALAKSLADLHEATLNVKSTEGQGSTFLLTLSSTNTYPNALHKEDNIAPVLTHEEDFSTDGASSSWERASDRCLLVVEDNADIREYIADSFSDDFTILQAQNGEEGLAIATERIPDIIITDIMMPKMDGVKMTKILKEDIRTSHIPVIMLTAKVTDDDKEEGYRSGADSYLTKPFTARLLATRIENLLTMRRRLAERLNIDNLSPAPSQEDEAQAEISTISPLDQRFIERLNNVILSNIVSDDLDLPFITKEMAMSHSTLYRKVKALTGLTTKEYIRRLRLRHCYQLLESGDYNVTEAAMLTGFNQMAHFRQTFKNEFGILPSEVKRKK